MSRLPLLPRTLAAAMALTTMVVGGCAPVGPNYKRPDLAPPQSYRYAAATQPAETMADLPWWQVFEDPQLQALLRDAIANNLDLRLAVARVQEARALAGVARSFLYPDISLSAGYTGNQASRNSQPPGAPENGDRTYNNTSVSANLSWEADLFGRLRRNNEAAFARYLATEEGRRAALVTLVSDVASAYFLLQELDLQLTIARNTLGLNERTVVFYTDRLNGGVSNRLEVDQAKANRAITGGSTHHPASSSRARVEMPWERISGTVWAEFVAISSVMAGQPALRIPPAFPPGQHQAKQDQRRYPADGIAKCEDDHECHGCSLVQHVCLCMALCYPRQIMDRLTRGEPLP